MAQPENSCLVIDDSYDQALQSPVIDHLFRVMSGKLSISVILMSQNTFSKGKYSRDIRNSCNFLALFRNCADTRINVNVTRMVGLNMAFEAAKNDLDEEMFPVMFLDLSQRGQMSPYRLYSDIFSKYQIVFSTTGMKAYIINANDFENIFKVKLGQGNTFEGEENENKITETTGEVATEIESPKEEKRIKNESKTEKIKEVSPENPKGGKNSKIRTRKRINEGAFQRWRKRTEYNLSKYKKHT